MNVSDVYGTLYSPEVPIRLISFRNGTYTTLLAGRCCLQIESPSSQLKRKRLARSNSGILQIRRSLKGFKPVKTIDFLSFC